MKEEVKPHLGLRLREKDSFWLEFTEIPTKYTQAEVAEALESLPSNQKLLLDQHQELVPSAFQMLQSLVEHLWKLQKDGVKLAAAELRWKLTLDAARFILKFGKSYTGYNRGASAGFLRWGQCFYNSYKMVEGNPEKPLYVEGICVTITDMDLHAWNQHPARDWAHWAIDMSLPCAHLNRYYGVALTRKQLLEVSKIVNATRGSDLPPGGIFHHKVWNREVRGYLEQELKPPT